MTVLKNQCSEGLGGVVFQHPQETEAPLANNRKPLDDSSAYQPGDPGPDLDPYQPGDFGQDVEANQSPERQPPANDPVKPLPEPEPEGCKLDLLQHLPDCSFKHYVRDVALMCDIPQNTSLLIALGIVSSVASRAYCVLYPNGEQLPLGEYIACSQPPGTGKSRMLKTYQYPINSTLKELFRDWKDRQQAADAAGTDFDEPPPGAIFATDSTPEGIDTTLACTGGFFALASAEQGLVNTLMGASYGGGEGRKNNNDLSLKGFNGEYHSSSRTTRKGYQGEVVGAITCFAQEGAIETILGRNDGVGFAERFLMLAEPNQLGQRDHTRQHYPEQYHQNVYNRIMGDLTKTAMSAPAELDQMPGYRLSRESWLQVYAFRNQIEPHLADGGKYSTATMRGTAAKVDMHIMKIAALLAILHDQPAGEIDPVCVTAAIHIMRDMLTYIAGLLVELGVTGANAFEDSIIGYIGNKGPATRRHIKQAKRNVKPWSETTPKTATTGKIDETIDGLIAKGILAESFDAAGNGKSGTLRLIA